MENKTLSATVPPVERRLAAILSADVKGYSRLMGEDEVATVRTLTAHREVMSGLIQKHRGRVVDSPGDNLLAEFASVVDALECAVVVQQALKERNAELPSARRMEFRIGINLGDVIVEGERIYGDGVNIAARLESLAAAGGICISGTVYDQVESKLSLQYDYLGEQSVKNITKPVRVYRAWRESELTPFPTSGKSNESTPSPLPELALPDKPSIAVLPFVNMSSDPEQEYFSDGITEDLITDLSKLSGLFVISRNSVLSYKGKAIKPEQVSKELGVRYVLEGSIRKAGNRVRITAQLIDATTGYHLWAERYDRHLEDIFAVQDEVTQKIVTALKVQLTEGEQLRFGRPLTTNIKAYDYYLRGCDLQKQTRQEANLLAEQMFSKALELDPQFAAACAYLGIVYFDRWTMGWSEDQQTLDRALALAREAVTRDPQLPDAHRLLGVILLWNREYESAIAEVEQAIALDPNHADAYAALGSIFNFAGRPEETVGLIQKAMRLNPQHPTWYLWDLGHAYYLLKRYDEATAVLKRTLTRNPDFMPAHGFLAIINGEIGLQDEAKTAGASALQISPALSLETLKQRLPYKDPAVLERVINAARRSGLV
jgi:adenylate cyclase